MTDYWKGFLTCFLIVVGLNAIFGYLAYLIFSDNKPES